MVTYSAVNRVVSGRAHAVLSAIEGLRDARRVRRDYPRLVPADGSNHPTLRAAYEQYVTDVSVPHMAVSWETAAYLYHLCEATKPRNILDLGSGFSSYVLRQYASTATDDVSVVSVDDSVEWLEHTRQFLAAHTLDTSGLQTWDAFTKAPGGPFDIIFHDLAGGALRETAMPIAVQALSSHGLIVFDDAHHAGHRKAALQVGRQMKLATYNLRHWTHDTYGRFVILGVRQT